MRVVTIRIQKELAEKVKENAKKDNRNISQQLNHYLSFFFYTGKIERKQNYSLFNTKEKTIVSFITSDSKVLKGIDTLAKKEHRNRSQQIETILMDLLYQGGM